MELFQQILKLCGFASIIPAGIAIFKLVSLLKATPIEKIFYTSEKNVFIRFCYILISNIPFTLLMFWYMSTHLNEDMTETNLPKMTIILIYFIGSYLVCLIVTFSIFYSFKEKYLGRYSFYIEHKELGKMYVIKSVNKKEVLLSEIQDINSYSEIAKILIMSKEELKTFAIFQTQEIPFIVKLFRRIFNKNTAENIQES